MIGDLLDLLWDVIDVAMNKPGEMDFVDDPDPVKGCLGCFFHFTGMAFFVIGVIIVGIRVIVLVIELIMRLF